MDVLLINARPSTPSRIEYQRKATPPLTLCYLASPLLQQGIDVHIIDMTKDDIDRRALLEFLQNRQPTIVGITCVTQSFPNCLRVAQLVKQNNPNTKVVVGGPHVSFTIEETLRDPSIDFVVRGEGDITFLELVNFLLFEHGKLENIWGIAFRRKDSIVKTGRRPLIEDLDVLPLPGRHLLNLNSYSVNGLLFTGRGCIGQCIYCAERAMNGGRYRTRSLEKVFAEVNSLRDTYGLNYIFLADEAFTANPERTLFFCKEILRRQLPITWGCESRVDLSDMSILEEMAKAGCVCMEFGGESGSDFVLESIRKKTTKNKIENAVRNALRVGIKPSCSFMIGHPEDTKATIMETIELAVKLENIGCETSFAITTPFPGTYLYNNEGKLGLKIISRNWEDYNFYTPVFHSKHLSSDEIRELFFEANEAILF